MLLLLLLDCCCLHFCFVKIVSSVSVITLFPGIMKNVVSGLANVPMMGFSVFVKFTARANVHYRAF